MSYPLSGNQLRQWRTEARQQAIASGFSVEEVDWLILEVSDLDRLSLKLELFKNNPEIALKVSIAELSNLWQRRLSEKVPLQYLVGTTPWRDFNLKVSPSVLIPRPETEEIIDIVVKTTEETHKIPLRSGIWVDLGTGSGAIAIGLAWVFPQAQVYGVDLSTSALEVAKENAKNTGLSDKIDFYQGSWWNPLSFLQGKVSGMVSNPPYIPSDLLGNLQPEVAKYEPQLALDGGEDGLKAIRELVEISPLYLKSGGIWLVEMMFDQGEKIVKLLKEKGDYQQIEVIKDISNNDRFVLAYKK